MTTGHHRFQ